jgi:hypothetical protein
MKSIRSTMLSALALALLGPCITAGLANAQDIAGKFTLPFAAHWGLANLPAGEYSLRLNQPFRGMVQLNQGTRTIAQIISQASDQKACAYPALLVVSDGAVRTVREMRLPGAVFYYAPHKAKRGGADEERKVTTIPLTGVPAGE